jgi:hypothetical protein
MEEGIRLFFVDQVEQWKQHFAADPNSELYKTLNLFQTFCNDYITYFQNSKVIYPIDWLKKRMEDTLMDYWLPLERVASQNGASSIYTNELQDANNEAANMVKKAKDLGGIEIKNAHIYLDKQSVARRYPFADMFFIGIPYRDAAEKKWSSLTHELGH